MFLVHLVIGALQMFSDDDDDDDDEMDNQLTPTFLWFQLSPLVTWLIQSAG